MPTASNISARTSSRPSARPCTLGIVSRRPRAHDGRPDSQCGAAARRYRRYHRRSHTRSSLVRLQLVGRKGQRRDRRRRLGIVEQVALGDFEFERVGRNVGAGENVDDGGIEVMGEERKFLEKEILKMQGDAKSYIQKVALMRFNPFDELGGDHSFTLALLDAHDNGIIFTGLHTRERTRVYVKNIVEGKSPIELSKEEERVLKEALTK